MMLSQHHMLRSAEIAMAPHLADWSWRERDGTWGLYFNNREECFGSAVGQQGVANANKAMLSAESDRARNLVWC
jgi:hypothetical protein